MISAIWERLTRRKQFYRETLTESKLDRCLTTFDLTALGIGSTLGVGIYVLAGSVAKEAAGPSVVLSFAVAAVASALSGLCYAELGARVPKAGSAYVYSYATVGEFVGFVIGWNLVLEYVIGTASVARGYSGYLDSLLNKTLSTTFRHFMPMDVPNLSPYPDLCSFLLTIVLTFVLSVGVKESTRFNNVFTCLNLAVVTFVTFGGLLKSDLSNWSIPSEALPDDPEVGSGGFFPYGITGMLSGAATCFYGYVGFDTIATSGEETRNPQTSIPISICLSLFIVFLGYFGVSSALTLMVPYYLQDVDAPLPSAFHQVGWGFAGTVVTVGALFGLSTSLLGAMFPMPRILYAMASDGLIFRCLADVNSTFQTPLKATLLSGLLAGFTSAVFELKHLVDMMSIGTLMAYTIVSASVILLRYEDVPGLGGTPVSEYMVLSPLSDDDADDEEDGDDDQELIYCRSKDLDHMENLHLTHPGGKGENSPLTCSDLMLGLFNADRAAKPTRLSTRVATLLTLSYSLMATLLAIIVDNIDYFSAFEYAVETTVAILVFCMTLCLGFLSLQPRTSQVLPFRVPLVPLLPAVSIFINVYLMLKLSSVTWVRFAVWMFIGLAIYLGYGWRNSTEEKRPRGP